MHHSDSRLNKIRIIHYVKLAGVINRYPLTDWTLKKRDKSCSYPLRFEYTQILQKSESPEQRPLRRMPVSSWYLQFLLFWFCFIRCLVWVWRYCARHIECTPKWTVSFLSYNISVYLFLYPLYFSLQQTMASNRYYARSKLHRQERCIKRVVMLCPSDKRRHTLLATKMVWFVSFLLCYIYCFEILINICVFILFLLFMIKNADRVSVCDLS